MFLVFAYDTYYPEGGMLDLVASADNFDEAFTAMRDKIVERGFEHAQIHDTATDTTVAWEEYPDILVERLSNEYEQDERLPRRQSDDERPSYRPRVWVFYKLEDSVDA